MAFVWEQRKLGEFVDKAVDNRGKTPPLDANGNHPLIEVAALGGVHPDYSKVEKYLSEDSFGNNLRAYIKKGDILFTTVGSIGLVSLMDSREEAAIAQNIVAFRAKENFVPEYLYALFSNEGNQYKAQRIVMGAVQPSIKVSQLVDVEYILANNVEEQRLIGEYFSYLDHLITLHQRKRVLRKCFFSIAWEQRKLGDIVERESSMCASTSDIPSVEYEDVIAEEGQLNKDICSKEVVKTGIAFDGSQVLYGKLRPYLHNWLNPDFKGVAVGDWWVLKPINMDKNFLYRLIQTQKFDNIANQSSGSKMPRADWNLITNSEFVVPISKEEQCKIGKCFNNLDHLVTLHQCKFHFCKKNEVNAWEQRKLGEVADIIGGGTPSTSYSDYWDGDIDWYAPAEISDQIFVDSSERKITKKGYENSSAKMLPVGAVLFTSRAGIGKTAILSRKGCTNQGFQSIVPHKDKLDSYFIFSRSEELKRYGETVGAGSTFVEVSGKQMANMELMLPENIEEQQVIGEYFKNLDHLITLHQWECNINENTEGNDEKQRKPIKKLIISEGDLSLVDDMFLLHRMTFFVCYKYILLRLNVVKYKITIIIINNILYSIVSLLIIACYLIVINKQLIILIYVEISVVIIKGDDDYARIRS